MAYVKRETGYWKRSKMQYDGYSCSVCHTKFPMNTFETNTFNEFGSTDEIFKFCPQCGSKMIEVRE